MSVTGGASTPTTLGVAGSAAILRGDLLLLLRRSASCEHEPGRWELPGGKMHVGETLVETVAREVHEETGISVAVGPPVTTWHFARGEYWVTGVMFLSTCENTEIRLSSEHDEARWLPLGEAHGLPLATAVKEQLLALNGRPGSNLVREES